MKTERASVCRKTMDEDGDSEIALQYNIDLLLSLEIYFVVFFSLLSLSINWNQVIRL